MRTLLAVAVVFLMIKILYFARGFGKLGPLVRMIIQIAQDIVYFLLILMLFVLGFAVGFKILTPEKRSFEQVSLLNARSHTQGYTTSPLPIIHLM